MSFKHILNIVENSFALYNDLPSIGKLMITGSIAFINFCIGGAILVSSFRAKKVEKHKRNKTNRFTFYF